MSQALAAALLGAALIAGAPQQQQQKPVFRSGVELVTLDVSVVDDAGRPIEALRPDDFEITVDGAPRRVVSAQFVSRRTAGASVPIRSQHFTTNEHDSAGRLILVAVDQMHIRRVEGRAALRGAAEFIDSLGPDDRVAAVPLTYAGAIQFTSDRAGVKRQVERLSGAASPPQLFYNVGLTEALAMSEGSRIALEQVVRRECGTQVQPRRGNDPRRFMDPDGPGDPCPAQVELEGRTIAQQARSDTRMSLNALRALVEKLGEIDGPKTVILVSEGLVAEPQYFEMSSLGAAAHTARVTIYVLQLAEPLMDASDSRMSPTALADFRVRGDGLSRLAGSARGALFTLVGSDPQPFRRILSELSGYYLLAFEPLAGDRDGGTHSLQVKVRSGGAVVRTRPNFHIPGPQHRDTTEAQLVRLLRDPRSATTLPLRVTTYVHRQPDNDGLKVVVAAETSLSDDVTMGYVLVNRSSVVAASGADTASGGRFLATATVPAGNYMLKVAVIDRSGQSGSVERHFDARLTQAGVVRIGDLILAEPAGDGFQPLVTVLRGNTLVAYVELYAADDWKPRGESVVFEVQSGDGKSPIRIPAVFERAGAGRWTATARYQLNDLQPGAYIAAVTLALAGPDPIRLSRPFAVEAK